MQDDGNERRSFRHRFAFPMPELFRQPSAGAAKLASGASARRTNREAARHHRVCRTGGGQPFAGAHTVWSAFLELDVPVLRQALNSSSRAGMTLQRLRQCYQSKFGFLAQPFHWLKLRAPLLSRSRRRTWFLNSTRTISYTPAAYADPLRPQDGARQLKIITGGNPALQPEKGKVWYVARFSTWQKSRAG